MNQNSTRTIAAIAPVQSRLRKLLGIYLSLALSLRVCVLHYIQVLMTSILISQENIIL